MANKRVKIYECAKVHGKWTTVTVKIPNLRPDGTLYMRGDRDDKFQVSWYEGNKKQWHHTTLRRLSDALKAKFDKEGFLKNQTRLGVQDPTTPDARAPITISIERYVESLTGSKRTRSMRFENSGSGTPASGTAARRRLWKRSIRPTWQSCSITSWMTNPKTTPIPPL